MQYIDTTEYSLQPRKFLLFIEKKERKKKERKRDRDRKAACPSAIQEDT